MGVNQQQNSFNFIAKGLISISFCILICLFTAFGVRYLYSTAESYFAIEYDFSTYKSGPNVGEVISLEGLMDRTGKSFSKSEHKELILIAVVDPECGASKVAKDQIGWIQEALSKVDVEYILVSFTSKATLEEFSLFADSFNLSTNSLVWKNNSSPKPESLLTMVVPSHFLIDYNGKILKKFPGTNKNTSVRKKMAKQIVKEVIIEAKKRNNF